LITRSVRGLGVRDGDTTIPVINSLYFPYSLGVQVAIDIESVVGFIKGGFLKVDFI
jgi:hypothetical protein